MILRSIGFGVSRGLPNDTTWLKRLLNRRNWPKGPAVRDSVIHLEFEVDKDTTEILVVLFDPVI